MALLGYMAIGRRFGKVVHLDKNGGRKGPRGLLLEKLGATHASKMYSEFKNGPDRHTGYIVQGEWYQMYEVHEWTGKA